METLRRREKMLIREEFQQECQRSLRAMELSVYGELMDVIRASGVIDDPKREVVNVIRKWFRIPDWRHQAETRRVATDERLSLIADTISGSFTTEEWLEEAYANSSQTEESPILAPLLSEKEILFKVIERRLLENGVDFKEDEEVEEVPMDIKAEDSHETSLCVKKETQNNEKLTITAVGSEEFGKNSEDNNGTDSKPTIALNPEVANDVGASKDGSGKKRRRGSSERESHSLSPDIANFSGERRKKIAVKELSGRLSYTSNRDVEREKRKSERDSAPKSKKSLEEKPAKDEEVISPGDQDRSRREASNASSSSSCLSASEAVEGIMSMMSGKPLPPPTRGKGLSRLRGRGHPPYPVRGRGRGRGKSQLLTHARPWPTPPQFPTLEPPIQGSNPLSPDSSSNLGVRGPKVKTNANGDEAKKRAPYKRKKQVFQSVSGDDFNESSTGIPKETHRLGQESSPPGRDQNKISPSFEQQFLRGNNQYYDPYYYDRHRQSGMGFNSNSDSPRHSHYYHQQPPEPELPPKIRQKTKHTVIIQDPHESIPGPPPLRNTQFVEYNNDSNLRHHSAQLPPTPTNSVIVRTPSIGHPQGTPPKIINPMSKTHITITQNPKPNVNFTPIGNNRPVPNIYDNQNAASSPASPYRNLHGPATSSSATAHKKRTQNLAAATTYTPQPDSLIPSSEGTNTELGYSQQHGAGANNSITATSGGIIAATASSLAVRNRPIPESKPAVSFPTGNPGPLPPLTSVVRSLPPQQNSSTPVVQRKAQPHILATSKLQRNAAAAANVSSTANSGPGTPNNPVPPSPPVSNSSSVIQPLNPIPGSQGMVVPSTSPNFNVQSTANIVSLAKTIPTAVSMTRAPGTNIIFVQKNPNASLPIQQATNSPSIQPGAMVKGSGKAVILRRANNSNVMVLNLQKNQLVNTPVSPVTQYLQSARFVAPQIVNQMSVSGSPIRKIIQTSGKILTPSATTIITSTSSTNPARTTRIFTTQSGNAVAIAVGKTANPATQSITHQQKPVSTIRSIGPNNLTRPTTETNEVTTTTQVPKQTTVENLNPSISIAPSSKPSATAPITLDSSSNIEGDINVSLLSDEVMMETSPPPVEAEEEIESTVVEQPQNHEQVQSTLSFYDPKSYPKTRISVVTNSIDSSDCNDRNILDRPSILNQALLARKPNEVQEEDEFEEGGEDDEPLNSSTISSQSQSSSVAEEEEPEESEDTQNEFEEPYDEMEDEEIELIDLADDDPPDSKTRNETEREDLSLNSISIDNSSIMIDSSKVHQVYVRGSEVVPTGSNPEEVTSANQDSENSSHVTVAQGSS